MNELTFIDLFAGTGGLSEGFIRKGFVPVSYIEKDIDSRFTIKTRLAYYHLKNNNKLDIYRKYISGQISREDFYSYIPSELLNRVINQEITEDNYVEIINKITNNRQISGYKKIFFSGLFFRHSAEREMIPAKADADEQEAFKNEKLEPRLEEVQSGK